MARPHELDKRAGGVAEFAQMLSLGSKRREMAERFGVSEWAITQWRKRADVQSLVAKINQERANRILSQTDTKIEKKLEQAGDKLSIDQLLKVRAAFVVDGSDETAAGERGAALSALMQAAHENPDLADALRKALPMETDDPEADVVDAEIIEDDEDD